MVQPDAAMVFAAGLGTRMRPVTERMPKPLVRVGGRTLLDHTLDRLKEAGVRRAVVNVHYLAGQIEAHLRDRREPAITISDERDLLLDQGGGLRRALPLLGPGPALVCNTDALWLEGPRSNLERLFAAWDPAIMDVLLLVAPTATSIGVDWAGDFAMDGHGRLARRGEGSVTPFVYAGVGLLGPEPFGEAAPAVFKLAPVFFDAAERGRLFGVRLEGTWMHVGTPEAIGEAEAAVARATTR